jgi:hypothetical protein
MNWCHREPTLTEILSDPIVRALMEADGINPQELEPTLREVLSCNRTEPSVIKRPPQSQA